MEKILDREDWNFDIEFYPPDTFNDGEYVLSKYAIFEKVEEGFLLFHTITRAMYLLTYDEFVNVLQNEDLIKAHIVNNSNVNEDDIAKRVYLRRAQCPISEYNDLSTYVIFTTNNCNARCPYCYENNGVEKPIERGMTLKTAEKTVQFILNTKKEDKFDIEWFGGEPLLNQRVIDYITQRLKDELKDTECTFFSKIITNGLLLNENTVNKLEKDWNVKFIQITLDGIEDKYNEIKHYKNIKFNPFKKIIKNIENVLKHTNITMTIRINVSEDNINDVEQTILYVTNKFGEYIENKRLRIAIPPIYQLDNDDEKITSPVFTKIEELSLEEETAEEPATESEETKTAQILGNTASQPTLCGPAVSDIRQAISLGDRFLFQRELFAGNGEQMQKALEELNGLQSLTEAMSYITERYDWDMESTAAGLFVNVLKRRFN